jgi:hypothetical protein
MAVVASVVVLQGLSALAAALPSTNTTHPVYAILDADDFLPLVLPDTWGAFSFRKDQRFADFPVVGGGMGVYDVVTAPGQVDVQVVKGGTDLERALFLAAVREKLAASPTQLYLLVSPQGVYLDYALASISYQTRPDKGSNLLHLNLVFREIPEIPDAAGVYSATGDEYSGPVEQLGQIYTRAASTAQTVAAGVSSWL